MLLTARIARTKGMPLEAPGKRQKIVTKAELGTKRVCPNCGARYYDLNHNPIICPRCGTQFEVATTTRARPAPAKAVVPEEVEIEVEKAPVEIVSLEEADEEAAGGPAKVEGDEEEIEGDDADDTFLPGEDEDEDENVEDIVGDVDDEER
jgi:uncharacterized protein (TIGR02300 family)